MANSKADSISMPAALLREAERAAREEGLTRNQLLRDAVRRYLNDRRWRELKKFGRAQARKLGLRQSDVERLVREYRNGH